MILLFRNWLSASRPPITESSCRLAKYWKRNFLLNTSNWVRSYCSFLLPSHKFHGIWRLYHYHLQFLQS
jgi:hypothetical protein